MQIEPLREFVVFARHLNFSAAAKELYIAQPTLSIHTFADFGDSIEICAEQTMDRYLAERDDVVVFDGVDGHAVTFDMVLAYRSVSSNPNVATFISLAENALSQMSLEQRRS